MSSIASNARATRGRRGARRLAVQALYQWLLAGGREAPLIADFLAENGAAVVDHDYFRELTTVCITERETLDDLLASCLDRPPAELDPVEHAILLVGTAELRDRKELAVSIVTNEAVELAKTFGAEGGHRYVNGVLDRLAADLRSRERTGSADSGG